MLYQVIILAIATTPRKKSGKFWLLTIKVMTESRRHVSRYKPLLFSTTMRSPERIKHFLTVLQEYDGLVLTESLTKKVASELIKRRLYSPSKLSANMRRKIKDGYLLSDNDVEKIIKANPQSHKESGFPAGWPSRFDTWYKIAKELGFVFYNFEEKIVFSAIGNHLVNNPALEQGAFLNAMIKYQRNNPFRRVLNDNVPLVLLLQVISLINASNKYNGFGISRKELLFLLFWKNNDAGELFRKIEALRKKHKYNPSDEVVYEICRNEILPEDRVKRDVRSIMRDYPDDFVRKMRMSGLISLRGRGRFIDINKNELHRVKYVLQKYGNYEKYDSEREYFEHVSQIDEGLFSIAPNIPSKNQRMDLFNARVKEYDWKTIKHELLILGRKTHSQDDVFKIIPAPLRLEYLTALAVKKQFPSVDVVPNYGMDDEGMPVSHAPGRGNTGDIECSEGKNGILIEVTLIDTAQQITVELFAISDHLDKFSSNYKGNVICYFVAPSIHARSHKALPYFKYEFKQTISGKSIEEFVKYIEESTKLYDAAIVRQERA